MSLDMAYGSRMQNQRGVVLFVSTIILVVLSLLVVVMAKSAVLENRMVDAARNAQLAQLAADSAMNEAKARIARIARDEGAQAVCASLRCTVRDAAAPVDPVAYMRTPAALAAANSLSFDLARLAGADASAQLAASPVYVVEDIGAAPASSGSPSRHLFRITAKGVGGSEKFSRVVECIYAVAEQATPTV